MRRADSEFNLIREFFSIPGSPGKGVRVGTGDDCALLKIPAGYELAVTVDTLVASIHYPKSTASADIGYKALAVNLSDLAAMGAEPAWATLALTIPSIDRKWLRGFAYGMFSLAEEYGVTLVGGDTTRGPVTTVTVQLHGLVPKGEALLRSGARTGDLIYVTGTLGDAALALRLMQQGRAVAPQLQRRLDRPEPRVEQGKMLRGVANACIDISDGLLADLGHILDMSGVGARLELEWLPLSRTYRDYVDPEEDHRKLALSGGDDYELCFTVPPEGAEEMEKVFARYGWSCSRVGVIEERSGLRCWLPDGTAYAPCRRGYDHFAQE